MKSPRPPASSATPRSVSNNKGMFCGGWWLKMGTAIVVIGLCCERNFKFLNTVVVPSMMTSLMDQQVDSTSTLQSSSSRVLLSQKKRKTVKTRRKTTTVTRTKKAGNFTSTTTELMELAENKLRTGTDGTPKRRQWNNSIMTLDWAKTAANSTIITNNPGDAWKVYDPKRILNFVHVGKAGGMTVRSSTILTCLNHAATRKNRTCVHTTFGSPTDDVLAYQLKYVWHMNFRSHNWYEMKKSTSLVVSLRNPVERLISSYRYSHPQNCYDGVGWSCRIYNESLVPVDDKGNTNDAYTMYNTCFPLPSMEDFAQSTLSPFPAFGREEMLTEEQIATCRRMATRQCLGRGPGRPNPHAYYNYRWYYQHSVVDFPGKEVFGIRTEYELYDLKELDKAIGGAGNIGGEDMVVSHGSEKYAPSPLTPQAYQKLCCLLEDDILYYEKFLNLAMNLNATDKAEAMENVKKQCDITTSWRKWRRDCKARIRKDNQTGAEVRGKYEPRKEPKEAPTGQKISTTRRQSGKKQIAIRKYRNITLVPISTSPTLRSYTSLYCQDRVAAATAASNKKKTSATTTTTTTKTPTLEDCMKETFPSNLKIASQIQYSFRWYFTAKARDEIRNSTTMVVTLQNPVERLIESYWNSHPANCHAVDKRKAPACRRIKGASAKPGTVENALFSVCFPNSSMEDFAQSTMSPYDSDDSDSHLSTLSTEDRIKCQDLAFATATGYSLTASNVGKSKAIPDMYFNYGYYIQRTLKAFPQKEFFGIRHEREWKDIRKLNLYLGGDMNMAGMAPPEPNKQQQLNYLRAYDDLTESAYRKLCCVLSDEIWHYREMLRESNNLLNTKQSMELVRQKCGIDTTWETWRLQCRQHLDRDEEARQSRRAAAESTE